MKRAGYIYVLRSETGPAKIGTATRPWLRIGSLRTGSPVPLAVEYLVRCVDARLAEGIEGAAHKILHARRQNGEWFSVSPEEAVAAISEGASLFRCELIVCPIDRERTKVERLQEARIQSRLPVNEELRRILKERRQQMNLSQRDVADRLGLTQRTISLIERGTHRVTVVEFLELTEVLDLDAAAIIRQIQGIKSLQSLASNSSSSPVEVLPERQILVPAQSQ